MYIIVTLLRLASRCEVMKKMNEAMKVSMWFVKLLRVYVNKNYFLPLCIM